jgi:hypothetical protein
MTDRYFLHPSSVFCKHRGSAVLRLSMKEIQVTQEGLRMCQARLRWEGRVKSLGASRFSIGAQGQGNFRSLGVPGYEKCRKWQGAA